MEDADPSGGGLPRCHWPASRRRARYSSTGPPRPADASWSDPGRTGRLRPWRWPGLASRFRSLRGRASLLRRAAPGWSST